jgi:hypothetical protein
MGMRDGGGGAVILTYDWKRIFIFRSKVSVYGNLIKGWQFVNRRIKLYAEGADGHQFTDYATDKELFLYKLEGIQ